MSGSGGPGTAELCSVLDVVSVACDTFLLTSLHLLTHLLTYSLTFGWLYCGSRPAALMVLVLRCTTWIELTSTQGGRRGKASHVSAVHSPIRPVSVSSRLSGTLVRMVQRTSYAAGKEMCSRSGEPMRCAAQLAVNGWCCRSPVPPRASYGALFSVRGAGGCRLARSALRASGAVPRRGKCWGPPRPAPRPALSSAGMF